MKGRQIDMDSSVTKNLEATKKYLEEWLEQHHTVQPAAQYARVKLELIEWMIGALSSLLALPDPPDTASPIPDLLRLWAVPIAEDRARLPTLLPMTPGADHDEFVLLDSALMNRDHALLIRYYGGRGTPGSLPVQPVDDQRLNDTLARFYALQSRLQDRRALICPSCKQERSEAEITVLLEALSRRLEESLSTEKIQEEQRLALHHMRHPGARDWACDVCFAEGKALVARPEMQELGNSWGSPYMAYFDEQLNCADCGVGFVFTAREKQHWYETLKFFYLVRATRCPDCRRKRRVQAQANAELGQVLKTLDAKNSTQLAAAAELYLKVGRPPKALEFFRRARNQAAASDEKEDMTRRIQSVQSSLERSEQAAGELNAPDGSPGSDLQNK
jgi:hypothetical protein